MAQYRLGYGYQSGGGVFTVNGVTPDLHYEEGTILSLETTLDTGFVSVSWNISNGLATSTSNPFVYTMPARDIRININMSGEYAPINGYGLKYYSEFGSIEGDCRRLEIELDGYGGLSTEVDLGEVTFGHGNFGQDILTTLIGSYLDFEILGGVTDYDEFLEGGNRDYRVKFYYSNVDTVPFFVGYITPDFVSNIELPGQRLIKFTAFDGLKGFDSIRANVPLWISPRNIGHSAIIGALNQSFIEGRSTHFAVGIHEDRMNSAVNVFEQFYYPNSAEYNEGRFISYFDGDDFTNERLYLSDVIERMVNPFTCRVFLWRNEWWVVRIGELAKAAYTAFKYEADQTPESDVVVTNGLDVSCDINNPERTAFRVFNEFNATLKLGVLDDSSKGAIIDSIQDVDDWFVGSVASAFPNIYKLRLWDYVRAIPIGQPSSVPSGTTAQVQYSPSNQSAKIWTSTTNAGLSDPNISWIELNSTAVGTSFTVAQETANKISISFEFMFLAVSGIDPRTFANYSVGIQVQIGTYYLYEISTDVYGFTLTPTIVTIQSPNSGVFNTVNITNLLVPIDGAVFTRLYQGICTSGTANQYALEYRKFQLKIEENEALTLADISVKGITDKPYSSVHPEYITFIGDAETNNSSSAIQLILSGNPVSENWSRDGIESLPLLDIIVQEIANLKGIKKERIIGTVERMEVKPYQSVEYNGKLYMVNAIEFDTYRNSWKVELFELGSVPTT